MIDRRCEIADDVARWVKEIHERDMDGQREKAEEDAASTGSTGSTYAEVAANAALILIVVAGSLLKRQLEAQAKAFEEEGGFTERLYARRQKRRRGR